MSVTAVRQGAQAPVENVRVTAYTVPTDGPESDGTAEWDSTTIVVVELRAGGKSGTGYTYAPAAVGRLVEETLAPVVTGRDVFAIGEAWVAMGSALRNAGRPGIGFCALSAVDLALWDVKARLLELPLADLLGRVHDEAPIYGSGGFTSYSLERIGEQLAGWVERGIPRVKIKVSRDPEADRQRLDIARQAIGEATELYVDSNGALGRKQALAWAERLAHEWEVTWYEEPVSAADFEGLRLLRDRARGARDRGRRVRICGGGLSQPHRQRLCRLPAGRRHPLRRHHRLPPGGRARGGLRPRPLRALRTVGKCRRLLCGAEPPTPRILPRPRATGANALRRRPRAAAWRAATRPLSSRQRPRAEACRRGAIRGLMRVPAHPDTRFASPPTAFEEVDVRGLEHDLALAVEGDVRFRPGDRALYATGGSNYRQLPIGVVIPRTTDDVVEIMRVCRDYRAPVLAHGGGTSLAGQSCNVAVVVDFSKYLNQLVELDPERRLARVQPGLILDHLRKPAEAEHQLTFGPDPSTHDHCTFGGMIGNNSCGVRSIMAQFYGPGPRMSDNVHELDLVLYDGTRLKVGATSEEELRQIIDEGGRRGEIYSRLRDLRDRYADLIRDRYPNIPRRVSGYNLDDLLPENGFDVAAALTGTEGTCAVVLEATVHLVHAPPHRSLLVLGYENEYEAADHVLEVLDAKPLGCEGVDNTLLEDMKSVGIHKEYLSMLPDGHGFLLVEFGGETKDEADEKAHTLMAQLKKGKGAPKDMKLYDDKQQEAHVWKVREAGLGATAFIPGKPDTYEGWEDSAVPPERLGQYLRDIRKLGGKYGYESALYGHYGNGCVHARWNFDLKSEPGIRARQEAEDPGPFEDGQVGSDRRDPRVTLRWRGG